MLYELIWIDSEKVFREIKELIEKKKVKRKKALILGLEPFLLEKISNEFEEVTVVCNDINIIEASKEFNPKIWERDNIEIWYYDFYEFLLEKKEKYDLSIMIIKPKFSSFFLSKKFLLLLKEKSSFVIINNDKPPLKKKVEDFKTEKILKKLKNFKEKGFIKDFEALNNTIIFY